MRTYKRINEDYLDDINQSDYTGDLSMDIVSNVNMLLHGDVPNIDFNLVQEPIYKAPDRTSSLRALIESCMKIYGNECSLNWIDVSGITDMSKLFYYSEFNGDISKWDVSSVTQMYCTFYHSQFNGNISDWDVSSVRIMEDMFYGSKFNGDISGWDVSSVMNMSCMFYHSVFNGVISDWDVSSVKNMFCMFCGSAFNRDISGWDVSSVTTM